MTEDENYLIVADNYEQARLFADQEGLDLWDSTLIFSAQRLKGEDLSRFDKVYIITYDRLILRELKNQLQKAGLDPQLYRGVAP